VRHVACDLSDVFRLIVPAAQGEAGHSACRRLA
jgi:hypothetical protein